MSVLPIVVIVILIVAMLAFSSRNRRRQAANQTAAAERLMPGTEVMTTSGLYGTVAEKYDDGTLSLTVAPGLQLRWDVAAVRDVASLPNRSGAATTPPATAGGYAGGPTAAAPAFPGDAAMSSNPSSSASANGSISLEKSPGGTVPATGSDDIGSPSRGANPTS